MDEFWRSGPTLGSIRPLVRIDQKSVQSWWNLAWTFFYVRASFCENFIAFGLVDLKLWSIQDCIFSWYACFESMVFESIGSNPWFQLLQLDGFDVLDSKVAFFRIDDVGTCSDRSLLATADRFEVASVCWIRRTLAWWIRRQEHSDGFETRRALDGFEPTFFGWSRTETYIDGFERRHVRWVQGKGSLLGSKLCVLWGIRTLVDSSRGLSYGFEIRPTLLIFFLRHLEYTNSDFLGIWNVGFYSFAWRVLSIVARSGLG